MHYPRWDDSQHQSLLSDTPRIQRCQAHRRTPDEQRRGLRELAHHGQLCQDWPDPHEHCWYEHQQQRFVEWSFLHPDPATPHLTKAGQGHLPIRLDMDTIYPISMVYVHTLCSGVRGHYNVRLAWASQAHEVIQQGIHVESHLWNGSHSIPCNSPTYDLNIYSSKLQFSWTGLWVVISTPISLTIL